MIAWGGASRVSAAGQLCKFARFAVRGWLMRRWLRCWVACACSGDDVLLTDGLREEGVVGLDSNYLTLRMWEAGEVK